MQLRNLLAASVAGLAFMVGTPAWAIDCEQIMGMLGAGVDSQIVVQTMQASGANYKPDEIQCLAEGGAPEEVIEAARALKAIEEPAVPEGGNRSATEEGGEEGGQDALEQAEGGMGMGGELTDLPTDTGAMTNVGRRILFPVAATY